MRPDFSGHVLIYQSLARVRPDGEREAVLWRFVWVLGAAGGRVVAFLTVANSGSVKTSDTKNCRLNLDWPATQRFGAFYPDASLLR